MLRRLALVALALCAFAALEGCGTSRLMGPAVETNAKAPVLGRNEPVGGGPRWFGAGERDGDGGSDQLPGFDPQAPVAVDQGDTLQTSVDVQL